MLLLRFVHTKHKYSHHIIKPASLVLNTTWHMVAFSCQVVFLCGSLVSILTVSRFQNPANGVQGFVVILLLVMMIAIPSYPCFSHTDRG